MLKGFLLHSRSRFSWKIHAKATCVYQEYHQPVANVHGEMNCGYAAWRAVSNYGRPLLGSWAKSSQLGIHDPAKTKSFFAQLDESLIKFGTLRLTLRFRLLMQGGRTGQRMHMSSGHHHHHSVSSHTLTSPKEYPDHLSNAKIAGNPNMGSFR